MASAVCDGELVMQLYGLASPEELFNVLLINYMLGLLLCFTYSCLSWLAVITGHRYYGCYINVGIYSSRSYLYLYAFQIADICANYSSRLLT